jgi:hypothetical protein
LDERKVDAITAGDISKKIHESGINFRYLAVIYSKLKSEKSKELIGADMVARAV